MENKVKRLLIQTQLSNYDNIGRFILEADSGWQMVMGRVRVMLELSPDLNVTVMCPRFDKVITHPWHVNPDLWDRYGDEGENRLSLCEVSILPNALATRYDFNWTEIALELDLGMHAAKRDLRYDAVYVNDPMHLRNLKAMFHLVGKYTPRFYVHSHFIDNPECPKFPTEASLWLGQCEAAIKADHNFWQCESSMNTFFESMSKTFNASVVDSVKGRSTPWDDGYSIDEITSPPNMLNVRFNTDIISRARALGKKVIFVPNRIGGRGRSSDYTNCGKFMFDVLPELRKRRDDFIVIAGNPNQKFSNDELRVECGPNGYVKLVLGALNREEYKYVAANSDIVVGLYDQDTYGGTAARECIELGGAPLWLNLNEYARLGWEAGWRYLVDPSMCDIVYVTERLLNGEHRKPSDATTLSNLKHIVRKRCSYESTTESAMKLMSLL